MNDTIKYSIIQGVKLKNIGMEDYRFQQAINKLLDMMHNDYKHRVGLAIYLISEETGFSTKELSYHLYKIKVFKREKDRFSNVNDKDYSKVYRG